MSDASTFLARLFKSRRLARAGTSLRFRLQLVVLVVALPIALGIIFVGIYERRGIVAENSIQNRLVAERLADVEFERLSEIHRFLKTLSSTAAVQSGSRTNCSRALSDLLIMVPEYANLGIVDAQGTILCAAVNADPDLYLRDFDHVRHALDVGAFAVSGYGFDRVTEAFSLSFAHPIFADEDHGGQPIGAAFLVVPLDRWSQNLAKSRIADGVEVYLLDTHSDVIAVYPQGAVTLGLGAAALGLDGTTLAQSGSEVMVGPQGDTRHYVYQAVPYGQLDTAFHVILSSPLDAALYRANLRMITRLVGLLSLIFAAGFLAARFLEVQVLEPLTSMIDDIRDVVSDHGSNADHDVDMAHDDTSKLPAHRLAGAAQGPSSQLEEFNWITQNFRTLAKDWRTAEKERARNGKQMAALLGALPDSFFLLDRKHTVLDYRTNSPGELLTAPERFVGKRVHEFLPPDALALFEEAMEKRYRTNEIVAWEYVLDFDGSQLDFEGRACPVLGSEETVIVVRNISNRRRAEELQTLSARVFEASRDGIVLTDAKGSILSINQAGVDMIGETHEALTGRVFADFVEPEDQKYLQMVMSKQGLPDPFGDGVGDGDDRDIAGTDGADDVEPMVSSGGPFLGPRAFEAELKCANGHSVPIWVSVSDVDKSISRPERQVIVMRDMTPLKRAHEEILRQASTDGLTGLPNRKSLMLELTNALTDAGRAQRSVALLFIDMDHLKWVNDRFGHAAGDDVLCQVAARLRGCLSADDVVARHAGDEFTLLLRGEDAATRVHVVAECVLESISRPYVLFGGEAVAMAGSIGIATYPKDGQDATEMLRAADQAMYIAKQAGGDTIRFYTAAIGQRAQDKLTLAEDLADAIGTEQLKLHYQPIVDLETGQVVMAEALLRWTHPEHGLIAPHRFIELAESNQLIGPLGDWVLERAVAEFPLLQRRFGRGFSTTINMSPQQLELENPDREASWETLLGQVARAEQAGGEPSSSRAPQTKAARRTRDLEKRGGIVLEITERTLLDPASGVVDRIDKLRDLGAEFALDDFGAGHSTLRYFLSHKFEYLKVDRDFVTNIDSSTRARSLCESILFLADKLDGVAIAEGVEVAAQARVLRDIGYRYAQGFFFARPMPFDTFKDFATQVDLDQ